MTITVIGKCYKVITCYRNEFFNCLNYHQNLGGRSSFDMQPSDIRCHYFGTEDLRFWRFPLVVGRCKYHLERYPLHCNLDHKWGIFRNQKKICNNPREREREREEGDYNYFHSGEMFSIDSRARCSNKYCLTRPLPFLLELKGYK